MLFIRSCVNFILKFAPIAIPSIQASNSAPAQLAEKHDDRHVRNKIEGVNRARGESGESIHHLYIAKKKQYIIDDVYHEYRARYKECVRMLNGLEKTLEQQIPESLRRWQ